VGRELISLLARQPRVPAPDAPEWMRRVGRSPAEHCGSTPRHWSRSPRSLEIRTVFALTLQEGFFHRLGFRTVPRETFPLEVWADCRGCEKLHACNEIAVAKDLQR
jgi:hypothetical protein